MQVAARNTSPEMTTVFHAWRYDRFIKIQSKLRRKKLHLKNQSSKFFEGSFSNRDNVRALVQIRRERQRQHLKMVFPEEQTHPFSHR